MFLKAFAHQWQINGTTFQITQKQMLLGYLTTVLCHLSVLLQTLSVTGCSLQGLKKKIQIESTSSDDLVLLFTLLKKKKIQNYWAHRQRI